MAVDLPRFRQKPDRRRAGRPVLPTQEKRAHAFLVHLTPEEYETIRREAWFAGQSASYMLRTRYFASTSR